MTPLRTTLALLLVLAAVLLAAGCMNENPRPMLEIPGSTTVVVTNVTSASDLETNGIDNTELEDLLTGVNRYDVVTFDLRAIKEKTRSHSLPITVLGKDYTADLARMTSIDSDNRYETYSGTLQGEKDSSVSITLLPSAFITGSVSLDGETFWIIPIDKEAYGNGSDPILHVIYNTADAPDYPDPDITDIAPSEKALHYYEYDETTGITRLTEPSLIGMENPAIGGDHIVWSWVYYGKRGLTLYTIPTGNYTEIAGEPFALSPPKVSGGYVVWADTSECMSPGGTNSLVLYNISSGTKTCICKNPRSPRFAAISYPYVVWQDDVYFNNKSERPPDSMYYDIYLYDIRTDTETIVLSNSSTQEYPDISGDRIVWSDYRNYRDGGQHKDYFLYNISEGSVTVVNPDPLLHMASSPYIHGNYVIWSDEGKGISSRVHLYDISTGQERILDDSSSGTVLGFSMSGDMVVWTALEFRGSDIPEPRRIVFDLEKGVVTPEYLNGSSPIAISGDYVLLSDSRGIGFCRVNRESVSGNGEVDSS